MRSTKMGMAMLMASVFGGLGLHAHNHFDPGDPDGPEPRRRKREPKGPPRQAEVDELSKKQRKVYSRVMRETEDRELALKAARDA